MVHLPVPSGIGGERGRFDQDRKRRGQFVGVARHDRFGDARNSLERDRHGHGIDEADGRASEGWAAVEEVARNGVRVGNGFDHWRAATSFHILSLHLSNAFQVSLIALRWVAYPPR